VTSGDLQRVTAGTFVGSVCTSKFSHLAGLAHNLHDVTAVRIRNVSRPLDFAIPQWSDQLNCGYRASGPLSYCLPAGLAAALQWLLISRIRRAAAEGRSATATESCCCSLFSKDLRKFLMTPSADKMKKGKEVQRWAHGSLLR